MPNDADWWLQLQRKARRMEPDVAREVLAGFSALRETLRGEAFERVIEAAAFDLLEREYLDEAAMREAFAGLRRQLQDTLRDATTYAAQRVPGLDAAAVFDVLNPRIIDAVQKLDAKILPALTEETREVVRLQLQAGLEAGKGPRAVARRIRESVGLTSQQAEAVRNFRRMLEAGDREALTRALRDRRFDATLKRALGAKGKGLTPSQVDTMVSAYRRRAIAHHAETVARTATLDSMKQGQRLSWEDAIDQDIVDRERMRKRWTTVGDSRVRSEHQALNGETVPFDASFSNGDIIPGESDWNCRCTARYFPARTP